MYLVDHVYLHLYILYIRPTIYYSAEILSTRAEVALQNNEIRQQCVHYKSNLLMGRLVSWVGGGKF